jgi:hypothetical protein
MLTEMTSTSTTRDYYYKPVYITDELLHTIVAYHAVPVL